MAFAEDLKKARMVGVPFIAVQTADQQNTKQNIVKILNGTTPVLVWDIVKGVGPGNMKKPQDAKAFEHFVDGNPVANQPATVNLTTTLQLAETNMVDDGVLILSNAYCQIDQVEVFQAIQNLRDVFKADRKTLIMLGPSFKLPEVLIPDIRVLDEPLPNQEQIEEIITDIGSNSDPVIKVDSPTMVKAVAAVQGLSSFATEQAIALALGKNDKGGYLDVANLWELKRRMIDQVRGLSMERPTESFDIIGGLEQAKKFITHYMNGPCKPRVILYIDEIEKMLAGSGANGIGDTSGTSQDQIGQFLTAFETYNWSGQINVGPPGSGKSLLARAVAGTFDLPLFVGDLGAAKGSLVGESERQIRALIKTLYAIAGDEGLYCIATCNRLHSLPPELRRRFTMGTWFFNLPSIEERLSIAKLLSKKFNTVKDDTNFWKETDGWSGANQRDCFKIAYAMNISIREAAAFIVPAEKQDPTGVKSLRELAHNRFLSASYAGPYDMNRGIKEKPSRAINLS